MPGPAYISSFYFFRLCFFISEPVKEAVANAETGTINRSIGMIQSQRRVLGLLLSKQVFKWGAAIEMHQRR